MDARFKFSIFAPLSALLLLTSGCKPTERNYKAAYEAAVAKRQTVDVDLDVSPDEILVEGQPVRQEVEGREVYYLAAPLSAVGEGGRMPESFNVVVGSFKMPVNALSQARSLRDEGLESFAAMGEKDTYYTVASGFETIHEALDFYEFFVARHPGFTYVGLPGLTVIEKR